GACAREVPARGIPRKGLGGGRSVAAGTRSWCRVAGLGAGMTVPSVVRYALDDETVVVFEVDPAGVFLPSGPEEIVGKLGDAVGPAVDGARVVLDRVKSAQPDEIELKFGIKVSGTLNWYVAKAATEATFEVTLKWSPKSAAGGGPQGAVGGSDPGVVVP